MNWLLLCPKGNGTKCFFFPMHVEPAKVRVLLVKAQSSESETSQRDYTVFNLSQICCQVTSATWLSLKIIGTILNPAFLLQCLGNYGVWFAVCSLAPLAATEKLFQEMQFPDSFLTTPGKKLWGRHDSPFASFGTQRKIFHSFTHSFDKYLSSASMVSGTILGF